MSTYANLDARADDLIARLGGDNVVRGHEGRRYATDVVAWLPSSTSGERTSLSTKLGTMITAAGSFAFGVDKGEPEQRLFVDAIQGAKDAVDGYVEPAAPPAPDPEPAYVPPDPDTGTPTWSSTAGLPQGAGELLRTIQRLRDAIIADDAELVADLRERLTELATAMDVLTHPAAAELLAP